MNHSIIHTLLLAVLLALGAASAAAQDKPQIINVPLSRPGEPISLEVEVLSARIEIIGETRDDAQFEITVNDVSRKIVTPSGTKDLKGGNFAFEIEEEDNEISFESEWRSDKVFITARIPQRANLYLSTTNDGEIIVTNITGSLELENPDGPITATRISGSVIAQSVSDDVEIALTSIAADSAMSLESVSGNLSIALPPDVGAQFHLDSSQGEIISDFEVEVQPSKAVIERSDRGDGVSVRVENTIIANVNGGGPVIRLKTLSGDINIRKGATR
jgi:DUF4097 and DUF4098 domain-containing protein YvlB